MVLFNLILTLEDKDSTVNHLGDSIIKPGENIEKKGSS